MTNYSKSDLVRAVAATCGVSKAQVAEILTATFSVINEETAAGRKVSLPGFGKFYVKVSAPRTGRNPRTGEPVDIPERRSLAFKAAKGASA